MAKKAAKKAAPKKGASKRSKKKTDEVIHLPALINKDDKTKGKKPNVKIESCIRRVRINFTEQEMGTTAVKMACAVNDRRKIKSEMKEAVAKFQSQIQTKETEIDMFSDQISTGYELRDVKCEVRKIFDDGLKEFWYGGKMVDCIPLTPEEYQEKMEFEDLDKEK